MELSDFVSSYRGLLFIFHDQKYIEILHQYLNFKCSFEAFIAVVDNRVVT